MVFVSLLTAHTCNIYHIYYGVLCASMEPKIELTLNTLFFNRSIKLKLQMRPVCKLHNFVLLTVICMSIVYSIG